MPAPTETLPDPQIYWPGELPLPEVLLTLGFGAAALLAICGVTLGLLSLRFPQLAPRAKQVLVGAVVPLVLTAPCYIPLYQRNIGRWAGLKAFLKTREAALQRLRKTHPSWSARQVIEEFHATDPGPWEYQIDPRYAPVVVYATYFVSDPPRIAVNFGGVGHDIAVFDPDTMWVDNAM